MRFSARDFFENGKANNNEILRTFIHESLHIASMDVSGGNKISNSGLAQEHIYKLVDTNVQAVFFNKINEGVTELITDAIYTEYLARKGINPEADAEHFSNLQGVRFRDRYRTYLEERYYVTKFIQEVTKVSGLGESEVIHALTKEYFSNGNLLRSEMREAFVDHPEIIQMLETVKRNMNPEINEDEFESIDQQIITEKSQFALALFGRDVIGEYNEKI
jgi:hypothetical protein